MEKIENFFKHRTKKFTTNQRQKRVSRLKETTFFTLPKVQTTLQPWKQYKNGVWSVLTTDFHGAPLQVQKHSS